MGAGLEFGRHHRVHIDHDLLLLRVLGVTNFDLFSDPIFERLADHGRANINDPLLRDLWDIGLVREVWRHLWLRLHIFKYLFE